MWIPTSNSLFSCTFTDIASSKSFASTGSIVNVGTLVQSSLFRSFVSEKPLTEHTVSEVLDLLRTGHQSPGIYTFTPTQLVQALNVSNISAEDKFDENTQNLLALNQSRWRIQTQGNLQGFYNDWRELGTLKPEDLAKQTEIAENIPSVWNQRQNLLQALIN